MKHKTTNQTKMTFLENGKPWSWSQYHRLKEHFYCQLIPFSTQSIKKSWTKISFFIFNTLLHDNGVLIEGMVNFRDIVDFDSVFFIKKFRFLHIPLKQKKLNKNFFFNLNTTEYTATEFGFRSRCKTRDCRFQFTFFQKEQRPFSTHSIE